MVFESSDEMYGNVILWSSFSLWISLFQCPYLTCAILPSKLASIIWFLIQDTVNKEKVSTAIQQKVKELQISPVSLELLAV